jgi:hypothetical protein
MAEMGPREYASKYWEMKVPILNDDNELVRWEDVNFNKYRLHMGWLTDPVVFPPGHSEFLSALQTYATRLFKQNKPLLLRVKNVWGEPHYISISTIEELKKRWYKATAAFSGKGSPEDVQLTLQLAARCGLAPDGLQAYCDKKVDTYARLGLDCNGFVGNYLHYRSDARKWSWDAPKPAPGPDTGINDLITHFGAKPVTNVEEMRNSRIFLIGLVDPATNLIINQFSSTGGVGHIIITEAINWGTKAVYPPVPQRYLNGRYMHYSTVESTPTVGLSPSIYGILNINNNSVATVWRNYSQLPANLNLLNVKICALK